MKEGHRIWRLGKQRMEGSATWGVLVVLPLQRKDHERGVGKGEAGARSAGLHRGMGSGAPREGCVAVAVAEAPTDATATATAASPPHSHLGKSQWDVRGIADGEAPKEAGGRGGRRSSCSPSGVSRKRRRSSSSHGGLHQFQPHECTLGKDIDVYGPQCHGIYLTPSCVRQPLALSGGPHPFNLPKFPLLTLTLLLRCSPPLSITLPHQCHRRCCCCCC